MTFSDEQVNTGYFIHTGYPMDTQLPKLTAFEPAQKDGSDLSRRLVVPPLAKRPIDVLLPSSAGTERYHTLRQPSSRCTQAHDQLDMVFGLRVRNRLCSHVEPEASTNKTASGLDILDQVNPYSSSNTVPSAESAWDDISSLVFPTKCVGASWDADVEDSKAFRDRYACIKSAQLSEAGPEAFECVYRWHFENALTPNVYNHVIDERQFIEDMIHLLHGLGSASFTFNAAEQRFQASSQYIRVTGCSATALQRLIKPFLTFGTLLRRLEHVVSECRRRPEDFGMTGIAFADALDGFLSFVQGAISVHTEAILTESSVQSIMPLVALQHSIAPISDILARLAELCGYSDNGRTTFDLPRGCALIDRLYHAALEEDLLRTPVYYELLLTLLDQTCTPLFDWLDRWLGIETNDSMNAFVWINDTWQLQDPYLEFFLDNRDATRENRRLSSIIAVMDGRQRSTRDPGDAFWQEGYQLSASRPPPAFMPTDLAQKVLAAGKCLRLLHDCRPDDPIFRIKSTDRQRHFGTDGVGVRWAFRIDDIRSMQHTKTIVPQSLHGSRDHDPKTDASDKLFTLTIPDATSEQFFPQMSGVSAGFFQKSGQHEAETPAGIEHLLQAGTETDVLQPPLVVAATETVCRTLRARCLAIDLAVLRFFLCDLDLRAHLTLLHRYVLMHDGVFARNLSVALFDDTNKSGLRLNSRTTWPPKASELSTALRTVVLASNIGNVNGVETDTDEPLSFGIKTYENEADICCDPQDIAALDFLCMAYKPPAPLHIILTASAMEKYNRLLTHLLRLARISSVMHDIYRLSHDRAASAETESQLAPLRSQLWHFVDAYRAYTFDCAIAGPWQYLMRTLERAISGLHASGNADELAIQDDMSMAQETVDTSMGGLTSLAELHELHEHTLDRMLDRCLLRQEHTVLRKIIDAIFGLVLYLRRMMQRRRGVSARTACELRKRLEAYMTKLLQGLSVLERERGVRVSKHTMTDSLTGWRAELKRHEEREGLSYLHGLMTRIDLNGYYASLTP